MLQRLTGILAILVGLAACVYQTACDAQSARDSPSPQVEPSGFLGDYSQLQEGRGDQAQLIYIDEEADFSGYERVLIDPVVVWSGAEGPASDVSAEELQRLARHLGAALREQLQLEFDLVENPSPGTLRLRSAITSVRTAGASVELEVLDAASGKRLVAVADAQGGRARDAAGAGEWANAEEAFDYWAQRARDRLAMFRDFDAAEATHEAVAKP
jgi:hypothetical protein